MTQAHLAMVHFNLRHKTTLASVLPCAIYTIPEVLMSGATKESVVPEGVDYVAGRASYEKNASGQIIGEGGRLLKLVF